MKRLMVLSLSVIVLTSVISPTFAFAKENSNNLNFNNKNIVNNKKDYVEKLIKSIDSSNLFEILNYSNNSLSVLDKKTNQISKIVYNDSGTEARVYEPNGQVNLITKDKDNNIYLNNVLVVEAKKNNDSNLKASNGWRKITTFRTKASYYQTTAAITLTILGFIPGLTYAAAIAGVASTIMNSGQPEVYIEMTQYYDGSKWFKVDTNYYKYSDYTGLIRSEYGYPYRIWNIKLNDNFS